LRVSSLSIPPYCELTAIFKIARASPELTEPSLVTSYFISVGIFPTAIWRAARASRDVTGPPSNVTVEGVPVVNVPCDTVTGMADPELVLAVFTVIFMGDVEPFAPITSKVSMAIEAEPELPVDEANEIMIVPDLASLLSKSEFALSPPFSADRNFRTVVS
jgi:hypothetical protein